MAVYISNFVIYTGTDCRQTFYLSDEDSEKLLDLTGYSGCAQMKRYETSVRSYPFNVLFAGNKKSGKVVLSMDASVTETIKPGKYFYDLLINSPKGITTRAIEGEIIVKRSITR